VTKSRFDERPYVVGAHAAGHKDRSVTSSLALHCVRRAGAEASRLGGRNDDRTGAEVRRRLIERVVELLTRVRREPDQCLRSEQLATPLDRDVLLAHVYPIGPDRRRQFGGVIHDEGDTKVATDWHHDPGGRDTDLVVEVLLAQLDHVDATAQDGRKELSHVLAMGHAQVEMAIREGIHAPTLEVLAQLLTGIDRLVQNGRMQIPAKAEYAIRALLTLAASDVSVSAEHLALEQELPAKFLGAILSDLRRGGLVTSQRGPEGGFKLAHDPDQITIADILRVVSGPMAGVRGMRPETLVYEGDAKYLREVWIAVRGALREVLEHVTLGQVLRGELPDTVTRFTSESDSWVTRTP
jgi:Rrf2 family protein